MLVMTDLPLACFLLQTSLIPACCIYIVPRIRVLVGASVHHLDTVFSVIKLPSFWSYGAFPYTWIGLARLCLLKMPTDMNWVLQHMLFGQDITATHLEVAWALWRHSRGSPSQGWFGTTQRGWAGNGNPNQCSIVWLGTCKCASGKARLEAEFRPGPAVFTVRLLSPVL